MPLGRGRQPERPSLSLERHHQHHAERIVAPPRASWPEGSRQSLSTHKKKEHILQVLVRDNNVDQAMRVLKKMMQREGIFREMKRRRAYEKPSERRVREKAEAVRRVRKLARKQAQREGLIAKPKPNFARPRRAANR